MCLILFSYRPDSNRPLVVAANRDEVHERASQAAMFFEHTRILSNPQRDAQSSPDEHDASVLLVLLAWKRAVCVLCSSAVDEPSSSADALQHCLQSLVGVRPSVLCSSARAGAQAVL